MLVRTRPETRPKGVWGGAWVLTAIILNQFIYQDSIFSQSIVGVGLAKNSLTEVVYRVFYECLTNVLCGKGMVEVAIILF